MVRLDPNHRREKNAWKTREKCKNRELRPAVILKKSLSKNFQKYKSYNRKIPCKN